MDFRVVGAHPARGELTAEIRLETPWFLPDVTWRLDVQFGELAPGGSGDGVVAAAPASAPSSRARSAGSPAHVERFDPAWNGEGVAPVHSVDELRRRRGRRRSGWPTWPPTPRCGRSRPTRRSPSTWSVAVNDRLGLGVGRRRRPRRPAVRRPDADLRPGRHRRAPARRASAPDRTWRPLEQKHRAAARLQRLRAACSSTARSGRRCSNKTWDVDVQVAGQPAPKKLLLNGVAPYEFTTPTRRPTRSSSARTRAGRAAAAVRQGPGGRCSTGSHWRDGSPWGGPADAGGPGRFTGQHQHVALPASRVDAPGRATAGLAPDTLVAAVALGDARACSREPTSTRTSPSAASGWRGRAAAADVGGLRRRRAPRSAASRSGPGDQRLPHGPARRPGPDPAARAARAYRPPGRPPRRSSSRRPRPRPGTLVEVDEVAYVGLRDYLDLLTARGAATAAPAAPASRAAASSRFLPNHEYELQLTTRVTIAHPSTPGPIGRCRRVRLLPHQGPAGPERGRAHRGGARAVRTRGVRRRAGGRRLPRGAGDTGVLRRLPSSRSRWPCARPGAPPSTPGCCGCSSLVTPERRGGRRHRRSRSPATTGSPRTTGPGRRPRLAAASCPGSR